MTFQLAYRLMQRGGKREALLSRVRPVTLLVACGIVLGADTLAAIDEALAEVIVR